MVSHALGEAVDVTGLPGAPCAGGTTVSTYLKHHSHVFAAGSRHARRPLRALSEDDGAFGSGPQDDWWPLMLERERLVRGRA